MPHGGVGHSGYGSDLSGLLDYTQVEHACGDGHRHRPYAAQGPAGRGTLTRP
ncbi:hypothetical protein [Streptomyces sp. NPDC046832]|uniref:hypothetical protein n=1 Tax=Streptomyces sp. NPDC046832 TaxID=3155020 RepID=UPI0033F236AB